MVMRGFGRGFDLRVCGGVEGRAGGVGVEGVGGAGLDVVVGIVAAGRVGWGTEVGVDVGWEARGAEGSAVGDCAVGDCAFGGCVGSARGEAWGVGCVSGCIFAMFASTFSTV